MLQEPLVSVVIPTYNREQLLEFSMESVLKQTYRKLELIIADDCSTDGTERLVKELMKRDGRIRYIKGEVNQGAGGARNMGASIAQGDFLAFNDSDAVWETGKLERQLEILRAHSNEDIGMIFHAYILSGKDNRDTVLPFEEVPPDFDNRNIMNTLLIQPLADTSTMLLPMSVWKEVGGFNSHLRCLEDYEFSMRVAAAHRLCYFHEPLITTYFVPGSVNQNWQEGMKTYFYVLEEFAEQYAGQENLKLYRMFQMWHLCRRMKHTDFFDEQLKLYVKHVGTDEVAIRHQIQKFIDEHVETDEKLDVFESC